MHRIERATNEYQNHHIKDECPKSIGLASIDTGRYNNRSYIHDDRTKPNTKVFRFMGR